VAMVMILYHNFVTNNLNVLTYLTSTGNLSSKAKNSCPSDVCHLFPEREMKSTESNGLLPGLLVLFRSEIQFLIAYMNISHILVLRAKKRLEFYSVHTPTTSTGHAHEGRRNDCKDIEIFP
jgi:hypothetical protein